jgi:hypothetical protein
MPNCVVQSLGIKAAYMSSKDQGIQLYIAVVLAFAAAAVSASRNSGFEPSVRRPLVSVISLENLAFAAASDDTPDLTAPP